MSLLYNNIKTMCNYKDIKMSDLEMPSKPGTISRYERRGTIKNLPVWMVCKAAKMFEVSVEDLTEKDLAGMIRREEAEHTLYGIFREWELANEDIDDLRDQIDKILEYAEKKKSQTDCAWR